MPNLPDEVEPPVFYGTAGADAIFDDNITGAYYGLGGNDIFFAHASDAYAPYPGSYAFADDHFYGGSGSDTVSYVFSNKGIVANLGAGTVHRFLGNELQSTDYLSSVENLIGSAYGDIMHGSNGANDLLGGGGNDTLLGLGGNDHVYGDGGNDTAEGGAGADSLRGGDGIDQLKGGSENDDVRGGNHADTLLGESGNDRLEGGSGDDTLDGGTGTDTAVYAGAGAVVVNLWLGTASGALGSDTLVSIERAETGNGNDIVFGSFGGNKLTTGGGNDIVYALDGSDWVVAGSGADTVYGYEGNDLIYGGTGNDRLYGGDGGDTIQGENGADRLSGDSGNDTLMGGAGNDKLRGGEGDDTINGGAGADVIVWQAGDDDGYDTIAGFNLAEDRLWFGAGFFAVEPVGAVDLIDVLMVFDSGANAVLAANTAAQGWIAIATLTNVDAYAVGQMIENESILAAPVVNFGGMPGDLL